MPGLRWATIPREKEKNNGNDFPRWLLAGFARIFTKNPAAYKYLAESIMNFPAPDKFAKFMEEAGMIHIIKYPLTFGITWLFIGEKPETG